MRRREQENPISLFPFLSVLAAVMGTLILALCGAVVGHMGAKQTVIEDDTNPAIDEAAGSIRKLREEEARLRKQLGEAQSLSNRVKQLQETAKALENEVAQGKATAEDRLRTHTALLKQVNQLQEQVAERARKLKDLTAASDDTQQKIQSLRAEKAALPTKASVRIVPSGGSGRVTTPRFVECDGFGATLHPAGTRIGPDEIAASPALRRFLTEINTKKSQGWSLVVLCRPDGVKAHDRVCKLARDMNAPYGSLPILDNEQIDFGAWSSPR
jgi:hypothetical protein